MSNTIYSEDGYTITADNIGEALCLTLTVTTAKGSHTWAVPTFEPIGPVPRSYRGRLPASWRGFWAGYPVRESARPAIEGAIATHETEHKARAAAKEAAIETACPGIGALRAAHDATAQYHDDFEAAMEIGDGILPRRPNVNSDELTKRYVAAATYLRLEGWSQSSHYIQASIGRKAMQRILAGEDHQIVMTDSDAEWTREAARCVANS